MRPNGNRATYRSPPPDNCDCVVTTIGRVLLDDRTACTIGSSDSTTTGASVSRTWAPDQLAPACRATLLRELRDWSIERIVIRSTRGVRRCPDHLVALYIAGAQFSRLVSDRDERLAARALSDPIGAARAAMARGGIPSELAAESGLALCATDLFGDDDTVGDHEHFSDDAQAGDDVHVGDDAFVGDDPNRCDDGLVDAPGRIVEADHRKPPTIAERAESTSALRIAFVASGMFADDRTAVPATPRELREEYDDELRDLIRELGVDEVVAATDLERTSIESLAAGESPDLSIEEAAAVQAVADGAPEADGLVDQACDHLLLGMTAAVMDVDTLAAEIDPALDLEPRDVQQKIERRAPMSFDEFVEIQHAIARNRP